MDRRRHRQDVVLLKNGKLARSLYLRCMVCIIWYSPSTCPERCASVHQPSLPRHPRFRSRIVPVRLFPCRLDKGVNVGDLCPGRRID